MKRTALDLTQPGWAILASVMILLTMGVASIYVTDTHYVVGHDGPRNAVKQCVFAFAGMILAAAVIRVGYQAIARHAYIIFVLEDRLTRQHRA